MKIDFIFAYSISEANREKLQTFLNNILAQDITENRPPTIWFPGRNEETFFGIRKLQRDYYNRYGCNSLD